MTETVYFGGTRHTPVVFLTTALNETNIRKEYIHPLGSRGLHNEHCSAILLPSNPKGKVKIAEIREFIDTELVKELEHLQAKYLMVSDAAFYKELTGQAKADADLGYVRDCTYGPYKVMYIPNYRMVFSNPDAIRAKINTALQGMADHVQGTYTDPGQNHLIEERYPTSLAEIEEQLQFLLNMPAGTIIGADIEAFSLKPHLAGIGTIAFSWELGRGISFPVDIRYETFINEDGTTELRGRQDYDTEVRDLLVWFFAEAKQRGIKFIWHNAAYDLSVLVYQLYMASIIDTTGLLDGIATLVENSECTKIITYLATNSCAGNKLGLKEQIQEYAGNYAVDDIKDIRLIGQHELLKYNISDATGVLYTRDKHWNNAMVRDDQLGVYNEIFKPAMSDIVQMQLTGLPVDMSIAKKVAAQLLEDEERAVSVLAQNPIIQHFTQIQEEAWVEDYNTTRKVKRVTLADAVGKAPFNPNSDPQLQKLLFEVMGLPVLDTTKSGAPATDGDVLKAMKEHCHNDGQREVLSLLQDFKAVNKINTSFMPAILNAIPGPDGWHYLIGNFNLGGTKSGRLSSNDPNLQNLPATGSRYAKKVKSCFAAPKGWLLVGIDADSLEDRISALTTKDPNKLMVYTDGYDGHCLRAFAYFPDRLPGIQNTLDSINSIAELFPAVRQDSKAPTFALTYQGTWKTLVKNCGFTRALAQSIENSYRDLYQVSIQWIDGKLRQATKTGHVKLAFGLRLRTPLLAQSTYGTSKTPAAVAAEGRTAGNALGQSWCMLNTRASIAFMKKVRASEFREQIRLCAQIHDAQYHLVKEDLATLSYYNLNIVEEMKWQDHPEIYHPDVKLGGTMFVCHPSWAYELSIPNGCVNDNIATTLRAKHEANLKKAQAA